MIFIGFLFYTWASVLGQLPPFHHLSRPLPHSSPGLSTGRPLPCGGAPRLSTLENLHELASRLNLPAVPATFLDPKYLPVRYFTPVKTQWACVSELLLHKFPRLLCELSHEDKCKFHDEVVSLFTSALTACHQEHELLVYLNQRIIAECPHAAGHRCRLLKHCDPEANSCYSRAVKLRLLQRQIRADSTQLTEYLARLPARSPTPPPVVLTDLEELTAGLFPLPPSGHEPSGWTGFP